MRWFGVLTVALLVTMVAEIVVFWLVAQQLGVPWTLAVAIATSVLGGWLVGRVGARGWRRFRTALDADRAPGREATYGLVGLIGALLLAVPGFVTDLVGLVLLLPPVRWSAGSLAQRIIGRRLSPAVAGGLFGPRRVRVRRGPTRPTQPPTQPGPVDPVAAIEGEILPPTDKPPAG